ncbi:MAG: hypothetical protein ACXWJD_02865 [Burkholderiaceae bacterium]
MKPARNLMTLMLTILMGMHITANAQQDVVALEEPGPIAVPAGGPYTLNEVRKSILSAAMRHEWRVESDKPGIARIILDGRTDRSLLEMDIVYDEKAYSIKYVHSEGLKYDKGMKTDTPKIEPGKGNYTTRDYSRSATIHPSYARWMKNLTNAINTELMIVKL